MNRGGERIDGRRLIELGRERLSTLIAAGRHRRRGLCMAMLLAVPALAWAQPLGLLLWARFRLLTDIPRTAMATEDEVAQVVIEPPSRFPDLAEVGFDGRADRDPLRISPHHFPRTTGEAGRTAPATKSAPFQAEGRDRDVDRIAELRSVVRKFRLQALISRNSIAIIDDRTYRVGELLDVERTEGHTFVLRSVGKDSVIIEADGHEFEVRLVGGGHRQVQFP